MTNRLANESSPYLQQHADNPVDWYPWGPEALDRARTEDKPLLLSVGYSACHWCHVMAHESFEDPEIAAKMNASFVNVKVDREERPDVDALYMEAVQAMTGHGGWPMTAFLTPTGEPFFTGTYFPPTARSGMPGFGDLLDAIAEAWQSQRGAIDDQAANVTDALRRHAVMTPLPDLPNHRLVAEASRTLIRSHDPVNGGFGTAPKFPSPMAVDVLFRHYITSGDAGDGDGAAGALRVAELTLDHMAAGGMYDHLGGGFARYSVDERWAVPHFEKMLYDNALLVPAYLHGWQLTGNDRHLQVVRETIGYVLRDLRLESGGFASAEDADSEGEEGRFYVWTEAELSAVLSPDEMTLAQDWYGVSTTGNFEGSNVLHRPEVGLLARPEPVEALRSKMYDLREQRVRPGLDDKVLTEWNALMISALAEAGAAADEPAWVEAAVQAMEFLETELQHDGRWYRSWQRVGGRNHLAYAADYAALTDAYTRLGEATGRRRWHEAALETAESMLELFWDREADVGDGRGGETGAGGLLTVGRDAEQLLVDRKDVFDSPVPSANGNAALALRRVAAVWDRPDLTEHSEAILRLLGEAMATNPLAHSRFLAAFDLVVGGMSEIVVTGDRPDLLAEVRRRYLPGAVTVHGERFDSPLWADRTDGQAYVCRNYTCGLPAGGSGELSTQLDALHRPTAEGPNP